MPNRARNALLTSSKDTAEPRGQRGPRVEADDDGVNGDGGGNAVAEPRGADRSAGPARRVDRETRTAVRSTSWGDNLERPSIPVWRHRMWR